MRYKLLYPNKIQIGDREVIFQNETTISKIEELSNVICFNTSPSEIDLDWGKIETHQVWKERCLANPSQLFCYDYKGNLQWKLPYNQVVGFGQIIPELKKEEDFITTEHYKKYIEKFKGKELLEVYAGNYRFVIDANTGKIYDKMESR